MVRSVIIDHISMFTFTHYAWSGAILIIRILYHGRHTDVFIIKVKDLLINFMKHKCYFSFFVDFFIKIY